MISISETFQSNRQLFTHFQDRHPIFSLPELLFRIFEFLPDRKQIGTLSLVNRRWCTIANDPHFWLALCWQTGVAVPHNQNAKEAYQYQCEWLLLEKIRECPSPIVRERNLEIDLENYQQIYFVESIYVVAYNSFIICICHALTGQLIKKIVVDSEIISSCATQSEIYLFLANGWIEAHDIKNDTDRAFLKMKVGGDEDIELHRLDEAQLFIQNEWLICRAFGLIQKWERKTGERLESFPLQDQINILQIQQNKIYAISQSLHALVMIDILKRSYEITIDLQNLPWNASYVSLNSLIFAFINENEVERDEKQKEIAAFNIDTGKECRMQFHAVGPLEFINLKILKDVAIIVYGPDPNSFDKKDQHHTIEVIDFQTKEIKHTFSKHQIAYKSHNGWSWTIFHDTIVYATTDNKIITISFSYKRKIESDVNMDNRKRRKITHS